MNGVEWHEVEEVLAAVMDLPPTERSARITQLCFNRPELQTEVESLLHAHENATSFLDVDTLVDSTAATSFSLEGKQLGPYRLLAVLGAGGMGTVYRAERTDGRFQKQVAIKVVPAALHSPELQRRFTGEQQILAALDHPNIARLFDAGVSPDGIPYFVMELVQGIPVNEYCEGQQLSTRERLALFRTLCSAVHYAHQHLVVHRDLKPANILVTADGLPKLLDFGIAKIVGPWAAGSVDATRSLLNPMTPGYASPEQIKAEPITTATDIYSIGVVLYELLTGRPPYQIAGKALDQAIRVVCESEPERPSAVVRRRDSGKTVSGLSSDLDAIVAKAMRKDPRQRYASAEEFASDIGRCLDGLPVSAHRGSLRYRAAKFVRRHRLGVGIAFASVVVLLSFGITMAVQARRIAKERDRANREAEASKRVSEFMANMFKVSDPSEARGNTVTAREILDRASHEIDPGLAKDPALQGRMMHVMGTVYRNLGLFPRAESLLKQASKIQQIALGSEHPDTVGSKVLLGRVLTDEGRYSEAEKVFRETLDIQRRVLGPEHLDTLGSMSGLALALAKQGRHSESEQLYRGTLDIQRRVLGSEHPVIVGTMTGLASILKTQGRYAEVEKLERQALDIQRRVLGSEHPDTLDSATHLALTLSCEGHYPEAEKLFAETLAIERRVLGPEHPRTLWSLQSLGWALSAEGRYPEAEQLYRETLDVQRRVLGPDHPDTLESATHLANALSSEGHSAEAEKVERETLETQRRVLGPEHPNTLGTMEILGTTLLDEGNYLEAEKLLRETRDRQLRVFGLDSPYTAISTYNLSCVAARRHYRDEALSLLREAADHGLAPATALSMEKDPDLKSLHGDPRFASLVAYAKKRAATAEKPSN